MKNILGLDIGTNSIGGALIKLPMLFDNYGDEGEILWTGSRIIPVDGEYLQKFESGSQAETKAAKRRQKRGSRRLKHRYKLRRSRLIKVFKELGWINPEFPLDESKQFKKDINENGYSLQISEYLPFSEETIAEFEKELQIEGTKSKKGKSIVPEDWIIYYLRYKALRERITIPELVRIIYLMNQRRGFKSSRKDLKTSNVLPYHEFDERIKSGELDEDGMETQYVSITKIKSVDFKESKTDRKGQTTNVYTISSEDSRMASWEESRRTQPEWIGKEFTFLVTQKVDKNGKFSQNKPQMPKEDDWALCTTALSEKIQEKNQHPGEYFFTQIKDSYLKKQDYKVRQYPVYRWRYEKELEAIWTKQCELNPDLKNINNDPNIRERLLSILYPFQAKHNMPKKAEFMSSDLLHIISKDIIYYQRELKSQKNSINECRFEKRKGVDGEYYGLKCIPRSSPLFQEFRIWQDIHNIRILKKEHRTEEGKTKLDIDVTALYMNEDLKAELFTMFNSKSSISESDILNLVKDSHQSCDIIINKNTEKSSHKINLFTNREALKGNETLSRYRTVFRKANYDGESVLTDPDKLMRLWHVDYSITSTDEEKSKQGFIKALTDPLTRKSKSKKIHLDLPEEVAVLLSKQSELPKEYGAYSACAIKKLLPVMRCGKYWNPETITEAIKSRSEQIEERLESINHNPRRIGEIADDDVQKQVLKSFIDKTDISQGLSTYQASYLVYDRHSEQEIYKINNLEEFNVLISKLGTYLKTIKNPIVQQVIRETMLLVRDLWKQYGVIHEIHIELGRDLKNNSDDRKKISETQKANFDEKQRIKKLLYELMNDGIEQYNEENDDIEQVSFDVAPNPESTADIEKFRIWKGLSKFTDKDWEKKVKDEKIPTEKEIKKYALWLSQNCRSPYTGKIIPLSRLFDKSEYEVEHIIPRSKMKNDSFNNLVIAEAALNPEPYKGSMLARNFISQFGGKDGKEHVINQRTYRVLGDNEYEDYCKETFKFQKGKLRNLLAIDVPEGFVERQLNDTRHINRKLAQLLAPVAQLSNGIIFTGGAITSELKQNWGLNSVWKDLLKPRFERLEGITGKRLIIPDEQDANKYHFDLSDNPKVELKRVDHRHHAMDAIIIAATTREHIRYLNTLSAADNSEEFKLYRQRLVKGKIREFKEPWRGFTKDVKKMLDSTIVSFKPSTPILSRPSNRTQHYVLKEGKPQKAYKDQKSNPRWMAVRRSMFKEPLGLRWIKEVKEVSVKEAFAVEIDRQLIDQDKNLRKTAAYIYDKSARHAIKQIIERCSASIDEKNALMTEVEKFLRANSKKSTSSKNTLYNLNGVEYDKIPIAHFVSYKTKRMSLNKAEYMEKLTTEKMENDFPNFSRDEKRNHAINNLFLHHIRQYDNNPKEAFNSEGIDELNKKALANPKIGKEIKSITRLDGRVSPDELFNGAYYETDSGGNVYFSMYENQNTLERTGFKDHAILKAVERINDPTKHGIVDDLDGFNTIILTPGDLVYVPTNDELQKLKSGTDMEDAINWKDHGHLSKSIYKMTDTTQGKCLFVPARIASPIGVDSVELGSSNKSARAWNGVVEYKPDAKGKLKREDSGTMIKETCIKLHVDRLGNIRPATS